MVTVEFPELGLKPQGFVLDAGCGLGRHLRFLAKQPNLRIVGIDKNTGALREALTSLEICLTLCRKTFWYRKPI